MVEINGNATYPSKDLAGRRYGNLTVEGFAGRDKYGNAMWRCRCDCGKEKNIQHFSLINGRSKSCGCRYSLHNPRLDGKSFGELTVIKAIKKESNTVTYLCRCSCGKEIEATDFKLKGGLKSCGCLTGRIAQEARIPNLKGKKYNYLTVEEKGELRNHRQYWKCRCDCGKEIEASTTELKRGFKKCCEDINCKYSLKTITFRGRLPRWYQNKIEEEKEKKLSRAGEDNGCKNLDK